jgi:hypothetical protein
MRMKPWVVLLTCVLGACEAEMLDGGEEIEDVDDIEAESAALSGSMVGVIPENNTNCPGKRIEIDVAPEMDKNNNHTDGWIGDWSWAKGSLGRMVFCKVPSAGFKPAKSTSAQANYAVLKLGASCPTGSFEVVRYFDLEDTPYAPSTTEQDKACLPSRHGGKAGQNLWLHLCVFKANVAGSSTPFPDLAFRYGVLGSPGVPGDLASGFAYNDDEDDDNRTHWEGNDDNVDLSAIIEGGNNSRMHLVRVR